MVGEWRMAQESQITGDERVAKKSQIQFKVAFSLGQARWNFLRSQSVEQLEADDADENSAATTLDFGELQECACRPLHAARPVHGVGPGARPSTRSSWQSELC